MSQEARREAIQVLEEAQEQITDAIFNAHRALRQLGDDMTIRRAEAYWIPTISSMVGRMVDRDFTGNPYDTSIGTTLEELREEGSWEDEDGDDEEEEAEEEEPDHEFAKRTKECPRCGRTLHDENEIEQALCWTCNDRDMDEEEEA